MTHPKRWLRCEALEDRVTPALTVHFTGSDLILTGDPNGLVEIEAVSPGVFDVFDNGVLIVNDQSVPGSIRISTLNDNDLISIDLSNGNIFQDLIIDTAFGDDDIELFGAGGIGVQGNVSISRANMVTILDNEIGGNISVGTDAGPGAINTLLLGDVRVGGQVSYTGSNIDDSVTIDFTSIGGSVTLNMGRGANDFSFSFGSSIGGSLSYQGGYQDDDIFAIDGTIARSAIFNMGNGSNTFRDFTGRVGDDLVIIGGTGRDDIAVNPFELFNGTIGRNLTIVLGHGTNTVGNAGANNFAPIILGSSFTYLGGNNVDTVSLGSMIQGPGARIMLRLQGGNDVVNYNPMNPFAFRSGYFDGGSGMDTFNFGMGASIGYPFIKVNF